MKYLLCSVTKLLPSAFLLLSIFFTLPGFSHSLTDKTQELHTEFKKLEDRLNIEEKSLLAQEQGCKNKVKEAKELIEKTRSLIGQLNFGDSFIFSQLKEYEKSVLIQEQECDNLIKENRKIIKESRSKMEFVRARIAETDQLNSEKPVIFSKLKDYDQMALFEKLQDLFREFESLGLDINPDTDKGCLLESTQNLLKPLMNYGLSLFERDPLKKSILIARATLSVEKWFACLIDALDVNADDAETTDVLIEQIRKAMYAKSKKVEL
ncbi:MAG: hypothetical protein WCK42_05190 [Myxococcaceae bacterium]